ncbi:hypothetical protein [Rhizobium sp. Root1220]|uniref:hypothetical protein n=1 Tax=Rhizobium sp. Root1220 TaxID=1736432 RepID=UPI0007022E6E|nr:hypothetical protein [Rhizobium sp. Root1220]KQV80555.1 hypothetical protein ASC90_25555 [Rhizobium sp. Root1220]
MARCGRQSDHWNGGTTGTFTQFAGRHGFIEPSPESLKERLPNVSIELIRDAIMNQFAGKTAIWRVIAEATVSSSDRYEKRARLLSENRFQQRDERAEVLASSEPI